MNKRMFLNARYLAAAGSIIAAFLLPHDTYAQKQVLNLTLQDVIRIAREQSPQAILAKHRFRASYWQYRTFQAEYRPSLSLSSTLPDYSREFTLEYVDGKYEYVEKNSNNSTLALSLSQNIGWTGGNIFVESDLSRKDEFGSGGGQEYVSTPVSIGFNQPIFRFNSLRWQKKIEPMVYEVAKKDYLDALENVSLMAVSRFFDLALAQQNLAIAQQNYSNSDTLFRISKGRYNIGTIAENELLQMELSLLNAGTAMNQANIDLQVAEFNLRSFLGYNESVKIELQIPSEIPQLEVNIDQAINLARQNNPDLIDYERQLIQAQRDVAQAKAEKGLNADLYAKVGTTKRATDFNDAYVSPLNNQEIVKVSLTLPIIDWGLGRGKYKMAQSNQEVVQTTVQQSINDFEQNIFLNVMRFNLQDDQVMIAAKADTIGVKRYTVTKERYLIGKIDVLDMNIAMQEKDVAKRGYITALRNYWNSFYTVRRLSLYDFMKNEPLSADYDKLVE
jgi:outer membrane protein TolC